MERKTVLGLLVLFFVIGFISLMVRLKGKTQTSRDIALYFLLGSVLVIVVLGTSLLMYGRTSLSAIQSRYDSLSTLPEYE
jgi:uncharacterized membrane protein